MGRWDCSRLNAAAKLYIEDFEKEKKGDVGYFLSHAQHFDPALLQLSVVRP